MSDGASNAFTPLAQQVVGAARKEADRLNHHLVTPEHLLLGLITLRQGVAVELLQEMGLNLEKLRLQVEKRFCAPPDENLLGTFPWTRRLKHVLALAAKQAKFLNHPSVDTEHILLALLSEPDGDAAKVLHNYDMDVEQIRQMVAERE